MKRRGFLKVMGMGALGMGGAFGYGRFVEPDWFEVTRHRVAGPFPEGLKMLHLSDFHLSGAVPLSLIEAAVGLALEETFDVVFLTGDFITDALQQEEAEGRFELKAVGWRSDCGAGS